MKIKKLFILFLIIFFNTSISNAYDTDNVHPLINENALFQSNVDSYMKSQLHLKNGAAELFKGKEVKEWLKEGARLEDETICRSRSHFHDPLKSWDSAGLNNVAVNTYCYSKGEDFSVDSSIIWSQKQPGLLFTKNYWSWPKAKEYYYKALTTGDKATRETFFAQTFRSLGQVMHLIADSSVPAHARNDIHVFPLTIPYIGIEIGNQTYESWAKKNYKDLYYTAIPVDQSIFSQAIYNASAPVQISALWDHDKYNGTNLDVTFGSNIGLAEYTNANFFSEDTIFKDYPHPTYNDTNYPYIDWEHPEVTDAEDGKFDNRIYIERTVGEADPRLAAISYISYDCIKKGKYDYSPFVLDDKVYNDYAALLIPRAVGYSAGLLDYFFRGNIEITLPDSGVYTQTDNPAAGFTQITLLAKNTTPNNEQMNDGTIELVVGYRRAIDDPFLNYPEDYPFQAENEISYIVVPEKNGIRSIPGDGSVELTFDLSQKPIPLWAINVFIRLIYHGRLGNEEGAVVVGFKDISEPTPIDLFNDMDKTCLNGSLYTAGSPEAIDQVDTNNNGIPTWDIYPHDLEDIYYKISPVTNPQYASATNSNFVIPSLSAGYFMRASYILTDYTFTNNSYQSLIKKVQEDPWIHPSWGTILYPGKAVKNQIEYEEDAAVCAPMSAPCHIWWYPTFLAYRGVEMWWGGGIMFINSAYPLDSECSCYQGILRNCMTGVQTLKSLDSAGKVGILRKDSADGVAEKHNAQMLPLTHKQRRIPSDR